MSSNQGLGMTPIKKKADDGLRFINSPAQKSQDLYQRLISASPQKRLFQFEEESNSRFQSQDLQSSEMTPEEDDSRMSPEKASYERTSKNFNEIEYTMKKVTTPLKNSKGCKCQRSHCLKKYCDCFKVGEVCSEDCSCVGCENTEITEEHERLVKAIELTKSGKGGKEIKCNCQKSQCLKNYCECHSVGRTCSAACKCLECENKEQSTTHRKRKQFLQVSEWSGYKPNKENRLFN